MCIGMPMQVIEPGEAVALCRGLNGDEHINMLMVGAQPAGAWVLTYLGWARDVISAEEAADINLAVEGLAQLMNGAEAIDVDTHFPGLGNAPTRSR